MHKVPIKVSPVLISPQTPAPRPIETIHVGHKKCFGGIVYIQKDNNTNIEDYFVEYDHWEKYSENKSYSRRSYQAAYKGMMKEYQNFLIVFEDDETEEFYVVAKRIRNELELLEPYCQCYRCVCSTLNPLKYLWCPHCTSCIKSGPGFAKQEYIDKAKVLKQLIKPPTEYKYQKYLDKTSLIKVFEVLFVLLLLLVIFV